MFSPSGEGWLITGRVIDGTGAPPLEDGAVVVVGDRISWVGPARDLPAHFAHGNAGLEKVALPGRTILPGLVDAHTHISFGEARSEEELAFAAPVEYRAIRAAWNAKKLLRAGVTSASDAASTYYVGVAVRDAVEAGMVEGPRFASAGPQLTSRQGLEDAFDVSVPFPPGQAGVLVKSRHEIIEAIRVQVKSGVDFIKVSGSSDSAVTGLPVEGAAFRQEEFDLIADEAHRLQRACSVHARTAESVKSAARAGFDWIMHASYIDDEGIDLVLERDIPIVPVLTLLVNIVDSADDRDSSVLDLFKREIDAASENLRRAHERGVRLLAGSESGWSLVPYGQWHAKEMEILVTRLGLSPIAAIHAATGAARITLPRWADEIGSLEPGRLADLIVVDGDPAADITTLQKTSRYDLVMKAGTTVDLSPIPERHVLPFEKHKLYLDGRFMFDEASQKGQVVR